MYGGTEQFHMWTKLNGTLPFLRSYLQIVLCAKDFNMIKFYLEMGQIGMKIPAQV